VRAGFSHGQQPIPDNQTLFNILAPAVVEDHITVGATWSIDKNDELSFSYVHAYGDTLNGSGSIPPGPPPGGFGGGEANLDLKENVFGVSFGHKL
jgi:long-chain fatty acid transport protein